MLKAAAVCTNDAEAVSMLLVAAPTLSLLHLLPPTVAAMTLRTMGTVHLTAGGHLKFTISARQMIGSL